MAHSKRGIISELKQTLQPKNSYLIAVSGGVDSVVLLHACYSLQKKLRLSLAVAHVDHGLRPDSRDDAAFVRELAGCFNLPYFEERPLPPEDSVNIESWGRSQRYRFFRELISTEGFAAVLTAHHADDVAETLLMKMLANKELSSIEAVGFNGLAIRPLLQVSRATIEDYASEENLLYRVDPSNQSDIYTRNRIRNKLLPLLRAEFGERVGESLARKARALDEDNSTLNAIAAEIGDKFRENTREPFGTRLWLSAIKHQLEAVARPIAWRLVEREFTALAGHQIGRTNSEKILDFLFSKQTQVQISNRLALVRRSSGIEVLKS
jgi:tRNA(Ile)-lysidine synthase